MGEFTPNNRIPDAQVNGEVNKFNTDVEGVAADDHMINGNDKFPIFDVEAKDFYQNMEAGRKRLRFSTGSSVQKYHQGTRHKRPFYIRHKDSNGKVFIRKIK